MDILDPIVNLSKFSDDQTYSYKLKEDNQWIEDIITELDAEAKENLEEGEAFTPGDLSIDLELERKQGKPYGDHLLVRGHVQCRYTASCVRCLATTGLSLDFDFQVAFLPAHLEKTPEFEELEELPIKETVYDLAFHLKGKAPVGETIRELIFLSRDPFPLHAPDCKGLCPQCGVDRNLKDCGHHV
jgi:uncharacterized metal-binding protein YceD (DUF177 family)